MFEFTLSKLFWPEKLGKSRRNTSFDQPAARATSQPQLGLDPGVAEWVRARK
jgi:hypothetical protein